MVLLKMVPTISIALAIVIPFALEKILQIKYKNLCNIKKVTANKCILYLCLIACLCTIVFSIISLFANEKLTKVTSIATIFMDIFLLYMYFDTRIRNQKIRNDSND